MIARRERFKQQRWNGEIIIEYMRNVFRSIEFWSNYPRANQHEILLSFLSGYDTCICAPIGLTQIHEQTRQESESAPKHSSGLGFGLGFCGISAWFFFCHLIACQFFIIMSLDLKLAFKNTHFFSFKRRQSVVTCTTCTCIDKLNSNFLYSTIFLFQII